MSKSENFYNAARELIPGGVSSPVRTFTDVGGTPPSIEKADDAYLYDADGKAYVDYIGSWGSIVLGYNHPAIHSAATEAVECGLSFGVPTEIEVKMVELVTEFVSTMDVVCMVGSGTEATMSAIRPARGFTGRDKAIKFEGCHRGHTSCLLAKVGSGALALGQPNSPDVPVDPTKHTLTCIYNALSPIRVAFEQYPQGIVCTIAELVAGSMNRTPSPPRLLSGSHTLYDELGVLLVVDKVVTGLRMALAGTQDYYGVAPDLTYFGKIIGDGMLASTFGGRRDVTDTLVPTGPAYQARTLSGNPTAMTTGYACLTEVARPGIHETLNELTTHLAEGLLEAIREADTPLVANHVGRMLGVFFTDAETVTHYQDAMTCDIERFKRFSHVMLDEGIYLTPSAFETDFMSVVHSEDDINNITDIARRVSAKL